MTIIAYKGGILAADSWVLQGDLICGETRKLYSVPEDRGGGWIAASGATSRANAMIEAVINGTDRPDDEGITVMWVKADQSVWAVEKETIFEIVAPFHAIGSGAHAAMGAMQAGATAIEAVQAACAIISTCGGEVQWVRV